MHEAVFKDRFRNDARTLTDCRQRHELGLHVRRKAGIRQGLDVGRTKRFMADDTDAVDFFLDFSADFLQFGNEGLQVFRNGILYENIALGHGCTDHESARFDAVGNDSVVSAMQFLDAFNTDDVGTGTADVGAHTVEVRC